MADDSDGGAGTPTDVEETVASKSATDVSTLTADPATADATSSPTPTAEIDTPTADAIPTSATPRTNEETPVELTDAVGGSADAVQTPTDVRTAVPVTETESSADVTAGEVETVAETVDSEASGVSPETDATDTIGEATSAVGGAAGETADGVTPTTETADAGNETVERVENETAPVVETVDETVRNTTRDGDSIGAVEQVGPTTEEAVFPVDVEDGTAGIVDETTTNADVVGGQTVENVTEVVGTTGDELGATVDRTTDATGGTVESLGEGTTARIGSTTNGTVATVDETTGSVESTTSVTGTVAGSAERIVDGRRSVADPVDGTVAGADETVSGTTDVVDATTEDVLSSTGSVVGTTGDVVSTTGNVVGTPGDVVTGTGAVTGGGETVRDPTGDSVDVTTDGVGSTVSAGIDLSTGAVGDGTDAVDSTTGGTDGTIGHHVGTIDRVIGDVVGPTATGTIRAVDQTIDPIVAPTRTPVGDGMATAPDTRTTGTVSGDGGVDAARPVKRTRDDASVPATGLRYGGRAAGATHSPTAADRRPNASVVDAVGPDVGMSPGAEGPGPDASGAAALVALGAICVPFLRSSETAALFASAPGPSVRVQVDLAVRTIRDRLPIAFPGYSRYDDSDPLENDRRARLYEAITRTPGCDLATLVSETDVSRSTARYHLRILEHEGLVIPAKLWGNRRLYPAEVDDVALAAALSDETTLAVLRAIARHEPASGATLADELDRDASTVTYHLTRLADGGLIDREREGRAVANRLATDAREALAPAEQGRARSDPRAEPAD